MFDNEFEQFAKPEILINPSALSSVVLRLKRLHIDRVFEFPFPNPPPSRSMKRAVRELTELGLMSRVEPSLEHDMEVEGELTTLGRRAATFPVSPRYGKFLALAAIRATSGSSTDMHELSVALVASMNCQNTPFRSLVSAQAALERAQRLQQEEKEEDEAFNGKKEQDSDDEERERSELEEARKREMTLRSQLLQQWVRYTLFDEICTLTHSLIHNTNTGTCQKRYVGTFTCTRCIHFCDITTIEYSSSSSYEYARGVV